MCEPVSMAVGAGVLGVGAAVTGGVMGTVGQQSQMEAQAAQYQYQAQVAELNRQNLEAQAYAQQEQGAWEKRSLALKQAHELGKARASFGASGSALGSGSLLLYEQDAASPMNLNSSRNNTISTNRCGRLKSEPGTPPTNAIRSLPPVPIPKARWGLRWGPESPIPSAPVFLRSVPQPDCTEELRIGRRLHGCRNGREVRDYAEYQ